MIDQGIKRRQSGKLGEMVYNLALSMLFFLLILKLFFLQDVMWIKDVIWGLLIFNVGFNTYCVREDSRKIEADEEELKRSSGVAVEPLIEEWAKKANYDLYTKIINGVSIVMVLAVVLLIIFGQKIIGVSSFIQFVVSLTLIFIRYVSKKLENGRREIIEQLEDIEIKKKKLELKERTLKNLLIAKVELEK